MVFDFQKKSLILIKVFTMDPVNTGLAAVGTVAKLASIPGSIRSQRLLEKQLKGLQSQKMARYTVSPEIIDLYRQSYGEASNPRGFGGANFAGFRNTLGRAQRGRFANAINVSGGQGSRAINAVLQGQEVDAIGNFYTADENLRRSNRLGALGRSGTYASQIQRTRDANTSNDISYRYQLERSLGEGIRSNKDFRRNLFGTMGSDLLTAGISGYFGDKSGAEVTGGNAMEQIPETSGSDYLYSPRGRASMTTRRNRFRELGAYK